MENQAIELEIKKRLSEINMTDDSIIREALRLGPIVMDPEYYKQYRKMTMDQFIVAHQFYMTLKESDHDEYFDCLESTVGEPKTDNEEQYWDRKLNKTPKYHEVVKFCKENNINIEVNTGLCYYVTCIMEVNYDKSPNS